MARTLRSSFQLPEIFEFPEIPRRTCRQPRIMKIDDDASALAAPAVAEQWSVNPYHRNFNPGTRLGQTIFEKKAKGLPADERFIATNEDSQGIRRFLQGRSVALGKVVTRILLEYDASGDATVFGDLLT